MSASRQKHTKPNHVHVLHSFRLEPHVDPMTNDMTVIAYLPEAELQSLDPIVSGEQRLHHMYVCSPDGRLKKSIAFTESDYRSAVNDYINKASTDDDEYERERERERQREWERERERQREWEREREREWEWEWKQQQQRERVQEKELEQDEEVPKSISGTSFIISYD